MHEVPHSPGRLQRWCGLLLDGENRWGFARIQVDRFGVMHYRLVLYPPGINDVERRWLRIWRGAPVWGAVLWVLSEIFLQPAIGPGRRARGLDGHRSRAGRRRTGQGAQYPHQGPVDRRGDDAWLHQRDHHRRARRASREGGDVDVRRRACRRGAHVAARPRSTLGGGCTRSWRRTVQSPAAARRSAGSRSVASVRRRPQ